MYFKATGENASSTIKKKNKRDLVFYPNVLDDGCSGIISKCALTSNLKLEIIKYYCIHIYLRLSLRTSG